MNDIENTTVFKILDKMPKGGLLHVHAIGDAWALLKLGSYEPDCWINVGNGTSSIHEYSFMYSETTPEEPSGVSWRNVQEWRKTYSDPEEFDRTVLYPHIQYYTPQSKDSENVEWTYFDKTIGRAASLASKESVWRTWVKAAFLDLIANGVYHVEIRGFMQFIKISGTTKPKYTLSEMVGIFQDIVSEINSENPQGPTLTLLHIHSVGRYLSVQEMIDALLVANGLMEDNATKPYVVGFDIVDEEDRYNSLVYYLDAWMYIKSYRNQRGLPDMPYFFHTAETDWFKDGASNLFDAVLLNTTRIGHGFATPKYPYIQGVIKQRGIAIEVCPISNQLLKTVEDIRIHPAREMLSNGLAVAISSDDPVIYGYSGLTYDFWEAYVGWNLTLAGLKKLATNSIKYSALSTTTKAMQMKQFHSSWDQWIASATTWFL